jgi:hypothetical protein
MLPRAKSKNNSVVIGGGNGRRHDYIQRHVQQDVMRYHPLPAIAMQTMGLLSSRCDTHI